MLVAIPPYAEPLQNLGFDVMSHVLFHLILHYPKPQVTLESLIQTSRPQNTSNYVSDSLNS